MVEETHIKDGPWHKVYEVQKKPKQKIPYEYVFDNDELPEDIKEKINDYKDMLRNYS
ncbi:protein of unknown function [Nitrospina watsonii]|uniref:Uncharacterized protein n=2 Tax=Nitrospina watsonii TaxID=1323948 RepID=A0ABM9HHC9_9BACT|nr:protein of unknown function [Nitrospina watsonii]